jgi:hypothetical protein
MSSRWIVHTKSGKTFTDKDGYPSDIEKMMATNQDEITSVERIINGRSIAIKKSSYLHDFFVKTTESKDFVMMGAQLGGRPAVVEAKAVGGHIDVKPGEIFRFELEIDPRTGSVNLDIQKVPKATPDGF